MKLIRSIISFGEFYFFVNKNKLNERITERNSINIADFNFSTVDNFLLSLYGSFNHRISLVDSEGGSAKLSIQVPYRYRIFLYSILVFGLSIFISILKYGNNHSRSEYEILLSGIAMIPILMFGMPFLFGYLYTSVFAQKMDSEIKFGA